MERINLKQFKANQRKLLSQHQGLKLPILNSHRSHSKSQMDSIHGAPSHHTMVASKSLKQYNKQVMKNISSSPFISHNIASEVLNKPLQKRAQLTNARCMKPYINPNAIYYNRKAAEDYHSASPLKDHKNRVRDESLSAQKSTKLIPIYQSKEYNKVRHLLPTIDKSLKDESLIKK